MITPMTHTYCGSCNRVRLTADGRLRTCLFGDHEVDLRTPLRSGVPLEPFVIVRSPRSRKRTRCSRVASEDYARSLRSGDSIDTRARYF
jgi:cyclic pyranopterin phosphate synthase